MPPQRKAVSPKDRTRRLLAAAAREQLRVGGPLTVQAVADRAGVSRATAYRYFPHNDAVVLEATIAMPSDPFSDPDWRYTRPDKAAPVEDQVAALVRGMGEWAFDHRRELETLMALSLQPDAAERGLSRAGRLNRGHLIDAVLASLPDDVDGPTRRRLHLALLPLFGADAVVWTTQVGQLEVSEAIDQLEWSARALVRAVAGSPPPPSESHTGRSEPDKITRRPRPNGGPRQHK